MATNVTVFAVDGPVVIYLQDGSTLSVDAGQGTSLQLPEAHMCTISDTPPKQEPVNEEEGEHPPPDYAFAQAMVEFWTAMVEKAKAEAPAATPVIATVTPQ